MSPRKGRETTIHLTISHLEEALLTGAIRDPLNETEVMTDLQGVILQVLPDQKEVACHLPEVAPATGVQE